MPPRSFDFPVAVLKLARVGNWPSAISNILAGYLIATGSWQNLPVLFSLMGISVCLFSAGMILNDWHDRERDARDHPGRPIPAGQILPATALKLVSAFLILAVAMALLVDLNLVEGKGKRPPCLTTLVTLATLLFIWLYDVGLKSTAVAPLMMGMCRAGNVLLGASCAAGIDVNWLGFPPAAVAISLLLAIYITGVTLFARRESTSGSRSGLLAGLLLMLAALVGYGWLPWEKDALGSIASPSQWTAFRLIIVFLIVTIGWRGGRAVSEPTPQHKRATIILALKSVVTLDAAACLLWGGGAIHFALITLALLPLSLLLSRWRSLT